jgi:membrane peptidoglycan carboxypeptidase
MPAMPLFPVPHRLMQVGRRPALAGALLLALLLPVPVARAALLELPPIDRIVNYQPKLHLQILTADGVEIGAFGTERRQFVPIGQIPKLLQDAVLAVEDTRFREHAGIDPKGMARAALAMPAANEQAREDAAAFLKRVAGIDIACCPHCRLGQWRTTKILQPERAHAHGDIADCHGPPP